MTLRYRAEPPPIRFEFSVDSKSNQGVSKNWQLTFNFPNDCHFHFIYLFFFLALSYAFQTDLSPLLHSGLTNPRPCSTTYFTVSTVGGGTPHERAGLPETGSSGEKRCFTLRGLLSLGLLTMNEKASWICEQQH